MANTAPWVVPFFMVNADAKGPFNMEVRNIEDNGVQIPILVNKTKIKAGEELVYDKGELSAFHANSRKAKLPEDESSNVRQRIR